MKKYQIQSILIKFFLILDQKIRQNLLYVIDFWVAKVTREYCNSKIAHLKKAVVLRGYLN